MSDTFRIPTTAQWTSDFMAVAANKTLVVYTE